jgi:predicted RNA binding protein YcfA (HicA-like mRNA interferase family)
LKARELMRILRALGAEERAGRGSHVRFRIGHCFTVVPNHRGEDLKVGTVNGIEADLEPCLGKSWLKKRCRGSTR